MREAGHEEHPECPRNFPWVSICMTVEVLFLQRTFITHVLNTISELEINNSTIDTLPALKVPLRAFFPSLPYLNN